MANTYPIDKACYETQVKYNNLYQTTTALAMYAKEGVTTYFTNQNNARVELETQVSPKLVEAELIKNIIKLKVTKTYKGMVTLLGTHKNFDSPDLTKDELEFLLQEFILNNEIEATIYLINKYPNLYQELANSYVSSRIMANPKYTKEDIDRDYLNDKMCSYRVSKIDEYYGQFFTPNDMQKR